jgi:hypothetical protein
MTTCLECNGTGQRDSGGVHPWGEPIHLACDCKDAEIGRQWREDSSLEKWFPLSAERIAALEAENAALKREAHTWSKAAEIYAAELERYKPLMQAVEWLLDDGHMNQEHLARLRAAFELARKKFALLPRDGGTVDVTCSVSLYPSSGDVAEMAKRVQDGARVSIEGPPDLFDGDGGAAAAGNQSPT